MNKYIYFQKTIHDRLITVGFHFRKFSRLEDLIFGYPNTTLLVTAIAIQHPTLDKADEEKGKIIVKSRIDRAKIADNKWTVIANVSNDNRMLFTYPVLKAMAEARFHHFETFPNDYIAGFDK